MKDGETTMAGRLEVVCGSMFSGKTEELMRRLKRAEYARQDVLTIKHQVDNRGSYSAILSHDGKEREAVPLSGGQDGCEELLRLADDGIDVVGIDEVQFFPGNFIDVVQALIDRGKRVICSGLDLDFRGEPFGIVPTLMAMADWVTKLHAVCMVCGDDSQFTQRLIDGRPAAYDDPLILVGASECYEARCRDHYAIQRPLTSRFQTAELASSAV
jgi:thymidine kinase